ncbi:hypothetical protein [Ferruginibacter sp. HRS2-29]|uniref:hypothetical protein n=1 Tax=Ferruginibacter sp. HRS2-29 TaxID=2487334 RepID=UPI0020CF3258|nr:hypothetical protein [Ferruginibacter sp. HRS2-29]
MAGQRISKEIVEKKIFYSFVFSGVITVGALKKTFQKSPKNQSQYRVAFQVFLPIFFTLRGYPQNISLHKFFCSDLYGYRLKEIA